VKRNKNPWNAKARAQDRIEAFKDLDWRRSGLDLKLGTALLDMAIRHGGFVEKNLWTRKPLLIRLSTKALSQLRKVLIFQEVFVWPFFFPMILPPRPWKGIEGGGYVATPLPLVKRQEEQPEIEKALTRAELGVACAAVNALQETGWRTNERLWAVLKVAWEKRDVEGTQSAFAVLKSSDRSDKADEIVMAMRFGILKRLSEERESTYYFPYQLDHRGRAYPIPQVIHPQADDLSRALLEFARGKPLGERGVHWLAVHVANTFGMGKLPFKERVEWVHENREAILDSAERPLEGHRFWTKAEKPWRFLAAAFEWAGFTAEGPAFVSHLPVAMDGTCNGLQHLSALGRDPQGGHWTNLSPGPKPQDLYQEVANRLRNRLEGSADRGDEVAKSWLPLCDRTLVKPATMTTPYGVTNQGIRDQLLSALRALGDFTNPWAAASYLAPILRESIGEVVVKAIEITNWLRALTRTLARKGRGLAWETPAGFPVVHHYRKLRSRRIRTAIGVLQIYEPESKEGLLDTTRQMDAIAPNLVHSLDAAHMMLTVRELHLKGLRDFAMVHDSYAVHASDVDLMNEALREKFVEVHQWFGLGEIFGRAEEALPGIDLPKPPRAGKLDIDEVKKSEYFFS